MTLREYTEDILRFISMCENEELDEEAVRDTFEALDGAFEEKADSYGHVLNELNGDYEKLAAEVKRLSDLMTMIDNNRKNIKNTLKWAMETTGKTKFKTNMFSFNVSKNGGLAPLKITGDVPFEFYVQPEPVVSNERIREFLKENTCDWAHLEERGTHVTIK